MNQERKQHAGAKDSDGQLATMWCIDGPCATGVQPPEGITGNQPGQESNANLQRPCNPVFNCVFHYLIVSFADVSTVGDGEINSWNWDFGNDETSDQQNPTNMYLSEFYMDHGDPGACGRALWKWYASF